MLALVSGGSASGKSRFAEDLTAGRSAGTRIYVATMQVWDEESRRRVARHRAMRAGKGFATVERPLDLERLEVPAGSTVLLEDLPNLAANEWFGGAERRASARERILSGVERLKARTALTVVVANELFSDGIDHEEETAAYLDMLVRLDRAIAREADEVYEVVCGIPVCWKGGGR